MYLTPRISRVYRRLSYVTKEGIVLNAETAARLELNANHEIEHWADPYVAAEAVFGLLPELAKAVQDSVPETE